MNLIVFIKHDEEQDELTDVIICGLHKLNILFASINSSKGNDLTKKDICSSISNNPSIFNSRNLPKMGII